MTFQNFKTKLSKYMNTHVYTHKTQLILNVNQLSKDFVPEECLNCKIMWQTDTSSGYNKLCI